MSLPDFLWDPGVAYTILVADFLHKAMEGILDLAEWRKNPGEGHRCLVGQLELAGSIGRE